MMKYLGKKGCHKDYLFTVKAYKLLAIKLYGIRFLFYSYTVKSLIYEQIDELINDFVGVGGK